MSRIGGIASTRTVDLLATAQDEHAAVAALGDCVAWSQRGRPAQSRLVRCDVVDLRAVAAAARRSALERGPR